MLISYINISKSVNKALDTSEAVTAFWREGYLTQSGKYFTEYELDLSDRGMVSKIMQGDFVISANLYGARAKTNDNWVGCKTIQVDVDGSLGAAEALAILEELDCNYVLRYSRNHGTGRKGVADRYHVLIPLDSMITDIEDLKVLGAFVESTFGSTDDSAKRASQCLFRGSTGHAPVIVGDRKDLSVQKVLSVGRKWLKRNDNEKLIEQAEEHAERVRSRDKVALGDGCHWLTLDMEIELKAGSVVTLQWVLDNWENGPRNGSGEINYEVVCPFCGHNESRGDSGSANAHLFVPKNSEFGAVALQCASCQSRSMGAGGAGFYNIHKSGLLDWSHKTREWLWFYNRLAGDSLVHIYRDKDEGVLQFKNSHMGAYKNNHKEMGVFPAEVLPSYDLKLIFESDELIIGDRELVNRYDAPKVLLTEADESIGIGDFKNINRLMRWAMGQGSVADEAEFEEIVEWHYDWLAWIVQNRRKVKTSWLFQGTEGTGKGMWFDYVINPIFGRGFCSEMKQGRLTGNFNKLISDSVFCLIDEVKMDLSAGGTGDDVSAAIKTLITQDFMTVEEKGKDAYKARIIANLYFFSNERDAVKITRGDRRFNVGFRQEVPLDRAPWMRGISPDNWKHCLEGELGAFVAWLKARKVNEMVVSENLKNSAWLELIDQGKVGVKGFWEAIRDCDYDWFDEQVDDSVRDVKGINMHIVMEQLREELTDGYVKCGTALQLYDYLYVLKNEHSSVSYRMPTKAVEHGRSVGVRLRSLTRDGKRFKAYAKTSVAHIEDLRLKTTRKALRAREDKLDAYKQKLSLGRG